jgi:tol-pal system protein YbgF
LEVGLVIWIRAKGSRRLPFAVFAPVLGVGLSLAGCADLMTDDALQQDVAQLRQDVNGLMLAARRGRAEPDTLSQIERRGREQASESTQQVAALSARIESLNTELTRFSVRLDQVSQRLESLGRQAPPGGGSARRVEPSAPSSPAPEVSPPTTGGPSTPVAQPTPRTGAPTPEESYQAAYLDFSKGRYSLAIPAFREFVRRFPDSALADSAQYGIGESYFSMARASADGGRADESKRELEQAVREFRKVIVNYPRAGKVPTALYKEALALAELKQTGLAQARLQYLLDHFPQSEEAPLAKERLAGLKQ